MNKIFAVSVFVFALSAGVTLAHGLAHDEKRAVNKIFIIMTDGGFIPKNAKVIKGTTVYFKNAGEKPHWPTSGKHLISQTYAKLDPLREIAPGEEWEFKFEKTGTIEFYDYLNPEFVGSIVTEEKNKSASLTTWKLGGFLGKIWGPIKNLFIRAYALVFSSTAEKQLDKSINKDSKAVFVNEDALFSYVSKFGPAQALVLSETIAPSYDRHNYAREIGTYSYKIFKNKAFQWHDSAFSAESMSGYFLGVIDAYFKKYGTENLAENLKNVSAADTLRSHVLGHSIMIWTEFELFDALESCDLISDSEAMIKECRGGVFMENIISGRSPETGSYSAYLNNDPDYPCTIVDEKYKTTCFKYMPYRLTQRLNNDFSEISRRCMRLSAPNAQSCFAIMGQHAAKEYHGDAAKIDSACTHAPEGKPRTVCVFGAARTTLWNKNEQETAINFCELLNDPIDIDECYKTIFSRAKEIFDSKEEYNAFCSNIETQYKNKCINFVPPDLKFY